MGGYDTIIHPLREQTPACVVKVKSRLSLFHNNIAHRRITIVLLYDPLSLYTYFQTKIEVYTRQVKPDRTALPRTLISIYHLSDNE